MKPQLKSLPDSICRGEAGSILALRSNGTLADRKDVLASLADGEAVELEIDVEAFFQEDGVSNRNFLRFKKSILNKLGKSFAGMPFIRDHEQNDVRARGGTILQSKAIKEASGKTTFVMTLSVSAAWAVEGILNGTIDRFSIGWIHPSLESVLCSECKTPVFSDCFHLPGDTCEGGSRVEFIFTEAVGIELSAVSVPAVIGTGITEIRSVLANTFSDFYAQSSQRPTRQQERKIMISKLAAMLSLDTEDESAVTNKVKELLASAEKSEEQATRLASAEESIEGLKATLAASQMESFIVKNEKVLSSEKLSVSEDFGKFVVELASKNQEAASRLVACFSVAEVEATPEPSVPLPALGSSVLEPVPSGRGEDAAVVITPTLKAMLAKLDITEEEYLKKNPINGTDTKGLWS
jgi:hypothetical protein